MNRILIAGVTVVALALPASAAARPDHDEVRAAKKQCQAERGKSAATREAFKAKYGKFARCVRQNATEEEAENETAHKNAAKECKAERSADPDAFAETYGTNANGQNALGKCVSSKAKAKKDAEDAEDAEEVKEFKNAAKECAAERGRVGREAFADAYGTNANKSNAFGKCVSEKQKADDDEE